MANAKKSHAFVKLPELLKLVEEYLEEKEEQAEEEKEE